MPLKKTTVMVDEDDLKAVKEAAAREGRPESEYIREAFHIVALRARFGGPVSDDDVRNATEEAVSRKHGTA